MSGIGYYPSDSQYPKKISISLYCSFSIWLPLQKKTSLLIEGPPFFKIAAAIIDHAANIGQISIKPHPKIHFEKYKPVVILYNL